MFYEKRELSRVGWVMGSLSEHSDESEKNAWNADAEAALAEAEAIVNEAFPDAVSDWKRSRGRRRRRRRKG